MLDFTAIVQSSPSAIAVNASIFVVGLLILRMWKVNPIHVMLGAGIIGIIFFSIF